MPELDPTIHRQLGVDLFNLAWDYMDKPERTPQEDDTMLNAAHASRYHWEQVGTALNLARGEWQLARVYAVLGRPEPALYHAARSLEIARQTALATLTWLMLMKPMPGLRQLPGNQPRARPGSSEPARRLRKFVRRTIVPWWRKTWKLSPGCIKQQ